MDDKQMTSGLSLLAEEAEPAAIDVYDVIAKAKARTRNRRASVATAFGTVAVVGAMAFTLDLGGDTNTIGAAGSQPTTTAPGKPPELCPIPDGAQTCYVFPPEQDDQSRKLDGQLTAVVGDLIPAGFTVEPDVLDKYLPALTFSVHHNSEELPFYTAHAIVRNEHGTATIDIIVLKQPPGTPLGHVNEQPFGPCQDGVDGCELRELGDGTTATAQANTRPPGLTLSSTMTAQRPDGTYLQVITNVGPGTSPAPLPDAPFTTDDLFTFATVFTY